MIWTVQKTRWLGKVCRFLERVSSTQDVTKEWILNGAPNGAVVVADMQTSGRGRIGRSWFSPPSKNLYFTAALQLPSSHPPLGTLSLLSSVAVAEALGKFGAKVFVKWANDVVSEDGRKLVGILVEGFEPEPKKRWALIGIGINVNIAENDFPDELKSTATSLKIVCGRNLDRFEVLAETLRSLEFWWEKWVSGELASSLEAYNRIDWLKGKKVRAILPDGTALEGTVLGVTSDGELRLVLPDGTERKLIAGDVSVRPAIASK